MVNWKIKNRLQFDLNQNAKILIYKKMHLKMPSAKWGSSCFGLNELIEPELCHSMPRIQTLVILLCHWLRQPLPILTAHRPIVQKRCLMPINGHNYIATSVFGVGVYRRWIYQCLFFYYRSILEVRGAVLCGYAGSNLKDVWGNCFFLYIFYMGPTWVL